MHVSGRREVQVTSQFKGREVGSLSCCGNSQEVRVAGGASTGEG